MKSWSHRISSLFLTHRRRLESIVSRKVRDRDIAADIVQDVFTRVLSAGPKDAPEVNERVLYASVRNAAIDYYRTEVRRARLAGSVLPEQRVSAAPAPDLQLEGKQALTALDEALKTLSPRRRDIFIMRRIHGLSTQEIARAHGISVNSVEKHIAHALRHCQSYLSAHRDH